VFSAWRIARMRRAWREKVIAGVPVLVSHDVGPAVIGLVHHGIVVPSWVEDLEGDAQRTVMTHEREHVRAGDPLLLWMGTFLVALSPWNPALWYALRRMRHAIEIDCDARVLRTRPDARAYCALLLDVGERTLAGVAPIAALAEPSTLLERRIDAMTSRDGGSRVRMLVGVAIAMALIACTIVAPRDRVNPGNDIAALLGRPDTPRSPLDAEVQRAQVLAAANDSSETALVPRTGDAIARVFPEILQRKDSSHRMLTLTYDYRGYLRGHFLRTVGPWHDYGAPDFSSVQISVWGMRALDSLNATLGYVIEKWNIDGEPLESAYGGRHGPAYSKNIPPQLQFARRVDSLARVDYPEAYTKLPEGLAVLVIFDPDGRVIRSTSQYMPIAQLFEKIPHTPRNHPLSVRSASSIIAHITPFDTEHFSGYGAQTFHDTPSAVLLFAEERRAKPAAGK
jgi:hypothetical protein